MATENTVTHTSVHAGSLVDHFRCFNRPIVSSKHVTNRLTLFSAGKDHWIQWIALSTKMIKNVVNRIQKTKQQEQSWKNKEITQLKDSLFNKSWNKVHQIPVRNISSLIIKCNMSMNYGTKCISLIYLISSPGTA